MLYKKNPFGRKYTYVITQKPWVFICFVLIGITLFINLTSKVTLDVNSVYAIQLHQFGEDVVIRVEGNPIIHDRGYFYTDKNDAVIPVITEAVTIDSTHCYIRITPCNPQVVLDSNWEKAYLEMPVGEESLFYRIIAKGGKNRE